MWSIYVANTLVVSNGLIDELTKKRLLAGVHMGDGVAASEEFSRIVDCSIPLLNAMHDRVGHERADRVGNEKQRLVAFVSGNIHQILSIRAQKTNDVINMLVYATSRENMIMDLQKLRINERPFWYQCVCRGLHISCFEDLLSLSGAYDARLYYAIQ